jgi:hypothetical protein
MINLHADAENIQLLIRDTSPSVYLDHWALLDISQDETLATRLSRVLEKLHGTLVVSWLNLGEYSKITVEEQSRKAEALLQQNLPRLFCIEVEPFRVISIENRMLAGGPLEPPHADVELAKMFLYLWPEPQTFLSGLTAHNFFTYAGSNELVQRLNSLADSLIGRIELMRKEVRTDESFNATVRALPSGPNIQRGTRYILLELLRTMLITDQMVITRNHAIDLLHAVVPVAYCDFVLLDSHWETQVTQMRNRITATGLSFPIANVFSKRVNGLEKLHLKRQNQLADRNECN